MGAISETTATDGDLVIETNFRFSMRLFDWCTAQATPFIYASSAATYGDGAQGFSDDPSPAALRALRPMNLYGWSKHMFALAVIERVRISRPVDVRRIRQWRQRSSTSLQAIAGWWIWIWRSSSTGSITTD